MDVKEIKQLDEYLKRLFGNPRLHVTPQKDDSAKVYIGEENIAELTVDDDDDERSYNMRMVIPLGESAGAEDIKRLDAYLKRRFDNERIRVVARPKKKDSVEAYIGDEFVGVLFVDDNGRSYVFELPILGMDLQP